MTPDNQPALPDSILRAIDDVRLKLNAYGDDMNSPAFGAISDGLDRLESLRRAEGATLGEGREVDPNWPLPCAVKLPPATTIGAGCKLFTLLTALETRAKPEWRTWFDSEAQAYDFTTPTAQRVAAGDDGLAEFTEYFVKNYPGPDTIISDPKWHAPRIFRAAQRAITPPPTGEAVAFNCAKATPDGGACEHWCGNRNTCISTAPEWIGEVVSASKTETGFDVVRFREGFRPKVGTKLYTHPAAQAEGRGVTDEMVERAFASMRGYDCFFAFPDESLKSCIRVWLAAALTAPADVGESNSSKGN